MKASEAKQRTQEAIELTKEQKRLKLEEELRKKKEAESSNVRYWANEGFDMVLKEIEKACQKGENAVILNKASWPPIPPYEFVDEKLSLLGYEVERYVDWGVESYADHQGQAFRDVRMAHMKISW